MAAGNPLKREAKTTDIDMPKAKRTKKPRVAASTVSTSTKSSSSSTHPYLGNKEVSAIEHWNESIPTKSKRATDTPNDVCPAIQAYMQAKVALFNDLTMKQRKSNSSLSTSQG